MEYRRFVGKMFRFLCLASTGVFFIKGALKYFKNDSSSLVNYRTFHDTKRDIYPTISICFYGASLFDHKKLNGTYEIEDAGEYIKFLTGDFWEDRMTGVEYDDVTFDIKDHIKDIWVIGMDYEPLYGWKMDDQRTNETLKGSDSPSKSTKDFPFYILREIQICMNYLT